MCKIDKLEAFDKIKVCVGYELDGRLLDAMPSTEDLDRVKPVYREMDGWKCDTTHVRKLADLPENAKKYLKLIEEFTGVNVAYAGVGPDRDSIATL